MRFKFLMILFLVPIVLLAQAGQSFFFIQLSDPQFGMYPLHRNYSKERRNLSVAVQAINRLKPDFVVVCGDLINRAGDQRQIGAFRRTIAMMDTTIPLFLVPGNHDVGNTPTRQSLESYRKTFGADYYSFERHGVTMIVLNSSMIKDGSKVREEAEKQLEWLKTVLLAAHQKHSPVIVFQHHPWFLKKPNESDSYFNVPRKTRMEYLQMLDSAGVTHVFAGHLHHNSTGKYDAISMVTSGPVGMPLGKDPSGLRIVSVSPNGVTHRYYGLGRIPQSVSQIGIRERTTR